jgi:hypothetical protein
MWLFFIGFLALGAPAMALLTWLGRLKRKDWRMVGAQNPYLSSAGGTVTRRCVAVRVPHVTMHGHATARGRATRLSGATR